MLDAAQLSGVGALVTELRADVGLATLVGLDLAGRVRVRGGEPVGAMAQSGGDYKGDARGPGDYQVFVVISTLDEPMHPSVPIFTGDYGVAAYGVTFANAREVWGAVVKAMHRRNGRTKASGIHIFNSVTEGGSQDTDPDTAQPLYRGTIRIIATANAVT